ASVAGGGFGAGAGGALVRQAAGRVVCRACGASDSGRGRLASLASPAAVLLGVRFSMSDSRGRPGAAPAAAPLFSVIATEPRWPGWWRASALRQQKPALPSP